MRVCISTYFSVLVVVVVAEFCCHFNERAEAASHDLIINVHLVPRRKNARRHLYFAAGETSFINTNNKSNRVAKLRRPLITRRQYAFLPVAGSTNSTRPLLGADIDRICGDVSFNSSSLDQSRAIKELKGRAQFAGQMEGVKTMTGMFAKFTERLSGRTGRRVGVRKATTSITTRTASKLKTAQKIQAVKGIKKVGQRQGRRQISKPISGLYTSKATTSLGRRQATKGVVRYSAKGRVPSRVAGKQVTKKVGMVAKGRVPSLVAGKQVAKKVGMAAGTRTKTKIARKAGRSVAVRSAAAHRRVLTSAPARRLVLKRLGRGVLIALPAIGGVFAILTFVADCDRVQEEYDKRRGMLTLAWVLFLGAACADYIDTLCQVLIAHSLFFHQQSTPHFVLSESISTACAIASTLFAVVGEMLSYKDVRHDASTT